jgi:hypothetical protein
MSFHALQSLSEPSTYRDVVAHHEWQFAMAEEIAALEHTCTWNLVPRPPSTIPITCKWVYKIKTCSGSIERYEVCLVARDFQQRYGHDYEETFAPVAHRTTVHTLIAVASVRRWAISCHITLCQYASTPHHLMSFHLYPLKNISENSRSMSHHFMPRHLSPLKTNSKNSIKSPHATSPVSIEK